MINETEPMPGDSDYDLIRKIILAFSPTGTNVPQPGDTKNNLLRKLLNTLIGA